MAVEASNGDQNSYAALQSPAMRQASTECVLEFYYHMYGEGKINTIVHIKGDTCLWPFIHPSATLFWSGLVYIVTIQTYTCIPTLYGENIGMFSYIVTQARLRLLRQDLMLV